ncbi:Dak1-domain-containing protein [Aspergillus homomorphus CBS 101889]|uniref:Dak1-domain-containing protein n=1 Tax=Aspergillus homomorphus (strain CBS 101889) TaxID=1450537 RepID=A0A395ICC6_ASPHC|nr:Dak1-domain-containing protein [Aspergillus homomorphus CBS 101889]RAL16758.1 Dak1-domain-containing protein [Aspergillus homomorphus CBS 101889]
MAARHFINDGTTLVQDALQGLALTQPALIYDRENKAIIDSRHDGNARVTLIPGGGTGHEPSFTGLNTIATVGGSARTVLIIMNYTGDVLHFHLAAEKARLMGHEMAVLVVGDNVSVDRRKSGKVGRRGLAGTVLVEKILGAVARNESTTLKQLHRPGEDIVANLATVGAALEHVHLVGKLTTDLAVRTDQVEVGMGIHNEPGCYMLEPQPHISVLVDQMLDKLVNQSDEDAAYVRFNDAADLVLMVNNLGGVSNIELSAMTKVVVERLGNWSLRPQSPRDTSIRWRFMTSLDGKGFSITLLKANKAMIQALDAPTSSPGWTAHQRLEGPPSSRLRADLGCTFDTKSFSAAITRACDKTVTAEEEIDRFDSLVGDGDCGSTLARTAKAILQGFEKGWCVNPDGDAFRAVEAIAKVVEDNMDDTSGALYAVFLNAKLVGTADWNRATPARVGDRTLMTHLNHSLESLTAARTGRDRTWGMRASLGRAVYVPKQ